MDRKAAPEETPPAGAPGANDDALLPLWRIVRGYIAFLFQSFGSPKEIALMGAIGPRLRAEILQLLHPVEALLRRLILRDALLILPDIKRDLRPSAEPPQARLVIQGAGGFSAHEIPQPDPEAPNTWRTHLSFSTPRGASAALVSDACALPRANGLGFYGAAQLALRFEACIRAFNTPEPYARRLARRLAANVYATRALLNILSHPPARYARGDLWRFGRDGLNEACAALRAHPNASTTLDSS